ncbi:MAG: GNAT family N-acetyltransferase [Parahaliea sp.]
MNGHIVSPHWQLLTFEELNTAALYQLLQLRQAVFIVEQNCPYLDIDGLDIKATHLLGWHNDRLIACLRCLPPGLSYPESSIGRVIIATEARGANSGTQMVQRAITFNRSQWPDSDILIGAQAHLQTFYGRLGFISEGEKYLEDGIDHVHMRLTRHPT